MVITYFFSILNPFTFTSAISFNFTSFSSSDSNITYERAFAENQVIQLTGNRLNFEFVGRATYFKPMRLWDKDSGKLTNFTTHFSFAIDSKKRSVYGDGIAFFLAPVGSKIPFMSKGGSTMGLCRGNQALDSVDNPFVAVEFDIYSNEYWDPPGEHVGIDLNSLKSVANISWFSNIAIKEGKINEAWITYNASSYNLSVVFTGFRGNVSVRQFLSANVDLSLFLPELVTIGFSASTGNSSAIHTIYSWDFSSSLEIDETTNNPKDPVSSPNIPAPKQRKNNTLGLAMGLGFGGFVLVARLVDHAKGSTTTDLAGTKGYIAPEYFTTNKATKESDVYSFGIVALEIASGRRAINHMAIEDHQVVTEMWVRELHRRGELIEAADPRLGGNFDELQMERLIIVGLWCAHPDYKLRPSIRQAIQVLNFEALLPLLPFDMPGPT
ncbi:l-type lectin-domain containing receptor kinase ix.1 [Quercus suber]|uniref:L-type lectin-domain containing receptor kinase ix.1 n=1 Tax=Quercus suber TaxID=58331 RepID=A0AAW0KK48_QUESU